MRRIKVALSLIVIIGILIFIRINYYSTPSSEVSSINDSSPKEITPSPTKNGEVKGITDSTKNQETNNENYEEALSCRDKDEEIRDKARNFMEYHVAREARHAVDSISAPTSESEKQLYDFLMGEDTEEKTPRLYSLSQFAYTTDSYTLGVLEDFGQHLTERGTLACRLQVYEIRTSQSDETFFQESLVRYLIFSITEDSTILTDFQGSEDKGKYAGFY